MSLIIRSASVGIWDTNAYRIEYNQQSVLIDPGEDFPYLDKMLSEDASGYSAILNTHGHFDHIGAAADFREKYQVPFYLHSLDKRVMRQSNIMRKVAGVDGFIQIPAVDHWLDEIDQIDLGGEKIKVHHTPGHTMGSVSFEIGNNLFSGDVIFSDSIGRTDLPGGNKELLEKSLHYLFKNFLGYTIYPGHGSPFILTKEIQHMLQP